ncbi:unnamed protein product, partial [marine sediment metagenome]
MATSTTNISLTKPAATDTTKIREDFNTNMDTIDGRFSATYMAVQDKSSVTITGGTITGITITGITDLVVADGGTGVTKDGEVANTNAPLPVSPVTADARLVLEGVAKKVPHLC